MPASKINPFHSRPEALRHEHEDAFAHVVKGPVLELCCWSFQDLFCFLLPPLLS